MNGNSGARLMYLLTHTPDSDRVGRSAAPDRGDSPIGGPAFEMPDTAPSAGRIAASARASVRSWSAPADPAILAPASTEPAPAPAFEAPSSIEAPASTAPADPGVDTPEAPAGGAELASNARKAFILAGRAIFTVQGSETRYTFKVSRSEPSDRYPNPAHFVSLLTGPDNTADYTYVGILDPSTGQVRTTQKSSYKPNSKPVKAFNWIMTRVWRDQSIAPATIYHIGRCGRCGRALTVPSSIEMGLGPECAGKLGA